MSEKIIMCVVRSVNQISLFLQRIQDIQEEVAKDLLHSLLLCTKLWKMAVDKLRLGRIGFNIAF